MRALSSRSFRIGPALAMTALIIAASSVARAGARHNGGAHFSSASHASGAGHFGGAAVHPGAGHFAGVHFNQIHASNSFHSSAGHLSVTRHSAGAAFTPQSFDHRHSGNLGNYSGSLGGIHPQSHSAHFSSNHIGHDQFTHHGSGLLGHHDFGHHPHHFSHHHHATFFGFYGGYYPSYFGYPYYDSSYYDPYYADPSSSTDGYYPTQDNYEPYYDPKDGPSDDNYYSPNNGDPALQSQPVRERGAIRTTPSRTRDRDDSEQVDLLNLAYESDVTSSQESDATDSALSVPESTRAARPPLISTEETPEVLPDRGG